MTNIVTLPLIHSVGSHITDTGSFSQVVALAHFVFDTEAELKETIEQLHTKVKFISEDGIDMSLRMLRLDKLRMKNNFEEAKDEE